jgi:hypothetical protein
MPEPMIAEGGSVVRATLATIASSSGVRNR